MASIPKTPRIADDERTTVVVKLLEIIGILRELIQGLRDEIARLKRQKSKPKIKPSTLEKTPRDNKKEGVAQRRPGSSKLKKTGQLKIHEEVVLKPESFLMGAGSKAMRNLPLRVSCAKRTTFSTADSDGSPLTGRRLWLHCRRMSGSSAATLMSQSGVFQADY